MAILSGRERIPPLIFVAGGIGITPFYSMLRAQGHSRLPVLLRLSTMDEQRILPFKTEFEETK